MPSSDSSHSNALSLNSAGELQCFEGSSSDVEQFVRFYLATRPSLRAYLATLLFDAAACEDCMQEAVIVLWKKRSADWSLEDFRKIAFTCARYKALSWLKKHKPTRHLNLSPELAERLALQASESDESTASAQLDRMHALRLCVEGLPKKQREIIRARYENKNIDALATLAKKLDRKMPALYKQLERTRTALKECVERKGN